MQATRLRKGMLIKVGEDLLRVLELQHVTPGNLRGFVRVKFRNIRTGTLVDQKLRSEDEVDRATLDEKSMQYLYRDGDAYHFMDTESYEQLVLTGNQLGNNSKFLQENVEIKIVLHNGKPIGVELPTFVELKIVQTDPGLKGDTAAGGTKPAKLETGAVIQVPLFLNEGDAIKVNTETGAYIERVK